MRIGFTWILCACLVIPVLAQAALNDTQIAQQIEQKLLPNGKDEVVLKIWGPVPPGTEIRGTRELVMVAPAEGYAVYIDDYPTANLFHPVRYAFIASATQAVRVEPAVSPPDNPNDYRYLPTAIGDLLLRAENRRAPLGQGSVPLPTRGDRWAVLMNGGYDSGNNHVRYWNDLSNIYITLVETYGFADDHIVVLCSDGLDPAPDQSNGQNSNPDLDGDGDADIMYSCILNNVNAVFGWLAANIVADDQLLVFTTDHGESAGGWNTNENLWNHEVLTDAHFAQLLDALPSCVVIGTFEPCYSGGFLDNMIIAPGPVIGSSACAYNELSWAMPPDYVYDTYVFHWTAAVKGEDAYGVPVDADYNGDSFITMDEAYRYAESHDQSSENPQYGEQPPGLGATVALAPMAAPLAPAAPTNFTASNNQAQLLATLNWTNPTLTFSGQPLTSISSIKIKRNGTLIDSLNGTPGQIMTYNNNVPAAANYSYQVYAVNAAGNGIPANAAVWIGLDTPGPVTALTGSGQDTLLVAHLSWSNPLAGEHGGYFNTSSISGYVINRYGPSAATFNLSGIQTAYTDNTIPTQGWYHYGVIAQDASGNGPETLTANFFIGPPEMTAIAYDWVEISGVGVNTGITGDDQNLGPFPLGFNFNHYGNIYNSVRVCSNGWISFTSTSTAYTNGAIPATAEPNNAIYALWDDLYPPGPPVGVIWYYHDAANSRFIVEWDNVMSYSSPRTPQKFEIILYTNGNIDLVYQTVQAPCTNSNTAGKENAAGTVAVQATYNGSGPLEPTSHTGIRIFGLLPSIPNVTITLVPTVTPVVIPATGGSFSYNATVTNGQSTSQTFDAWIMVQLPSGSWYGPVLGPFNLTLATGVSITRLRTQTVPASAPAGQYLYEGRTGTYPGMIWHTGSFPFTKQTSGNAIPISDWENFGESFENWLTTSTQIPAVFALHGSFPNPFNPTTTISFSLPSAERISLKVYDLSGRLVNTVVEGWREAGQHQVTFNGSALASGIYLYRLEAGSYTAGGKMALIK